MFRWLTNIWKPQRAERPIRLVRARYDAAGTNDDNRRHWANADGLSANAANSPRVRQTLRNRARYETNNNCYAKGIVLTIANGVIGTGPRLQMLTDDSEANRQIERSFTRWTTAVQLAEKLRTMRMARSTDGEAFALLIHNPRVRHSVQLDLKLIEAEQVASDDTDVDGIVFDKSGNPVEYRVLKQHPGDGLSFVEPETVRIPADSMLHWFRVERPGQSRGIPSLTPALPLFAQLRRFTLAVLGSAETAANFAGILYTDAPANGEADAAEPFEPIELERRALVTMPGGWRMEQIRAEQPTTSHRDFIESILNEIARAELMAFNVAYGNSASYNYASGRLDHQTYGKAIRIEQSHLETAVLDRLLAAWLSEAVYIPGLLPDGLGPFIDLDHAWMWDGMEHVDPAKEASAQATRLASNTTTLAFEYARQGRDWEDALRQRAKEVALMKELGLVPEAAPPEATTEEDDAEQPAFPNDD